MSGDNQKIPKGKDKNNNSKGKLKQIEPQPNSGNLAGKGKESLITLPKYLENRSEVLKPIRMKAEIRLLIFLT
jgi:hypothetical protein